MMMLRAVLCAALLSLPSYSLSAAPAAQSSQPVSLDKIIVDISPQQIAGKPLIGHARLLLLDVQGNLEIDYNIMEYPITLQTSEGGLSPGILSDPGFVDSGTVNLTTAGVKYLGPSAYLPVNATNGIITSASSLISFNGYDVVGASDITGNVLRQIFSEVPMSARVLVRNGGTKVADSNPSLRAYFTSGTGGSTRVFFPPKNNGAVDTISISLPTSGLAPGLDTLVLDLESIYRIDTGLYTARNRVFLPMTVLPQTNTSLVDGSIKPDSVYAGQDFPLSFDVSAAGFQGTIDSGYLHVDLTNGVGQPALTTLYSGPIHYTGFQNDVISYDGIPAQISLTAGLLPGWYHLRMSYELVSGGSVFSLTDLEPDSIYILPVTVPQYVPGTFKPDTVGAGSLATFQFDLAVTSNVPLQIDPAPGKAIFSVVGTGGFMATGNLIVTHDSLQPGLNTINTEKIFVPANQLGQDLSISASLGYTQSPPTYLTFTTDFGGELIHVQQLPIAQIINVDVVSYNAPKVNVGQPYQILVRVANVSDLPIDNLVLRLTSDGTSIDTLLDTIPYIAARDTASAYFDIVSSEPNPNELFRAAIISTHHGQIDPASGDDFAIAQVQYPASLYLTKSLLGTKGESNFVRTGGQFSLVVTLSAPGLGQASTTPGTYHLSSQGVYLGLPDPISGRDTVGEIAVGNPLGFQFTAPNKDTTFVLSFTLTQRPIDLNTGQPALIQTDTSFQFLITVASTAAELHVKSIPVSAASLYRLEVQELFQLELTNRAQSEVNKIQVDSAKFHVTTETGQPLDAADMLGVTGSGFYNGATRVASVAFVNDTIKAYFDSLVMGAGQVETLSFRARVIADVGQVFGIMLDTFKLDSVGLSAHYTDGPAANELVNITSPQNGSTVFGRKYVVSGKSLSQSFKIWDNPWHPEKGKARFEYHLDQPSAVDFRIFTLGGESVLSAHLDEGTSSTAAGDNFWEWDGRNGAGRAVFDGVYLVTITVARTGEEARIKVAVVK